MSSILKSLRWRIIAYYTTLLAVAIAIVVALGHRNETRHLSQLSLARMQNKGLGLMPFLFPPAPPSGRPRRAPHMDHPELLRLLEDTQQSGFFLLAVDHSGALVFSSPDLPSDFRTTKARFDGEDSGFLVTELRTPREDRLILGMPMGSLREKANRSLSVSVALGVGGLVILALLGGLLLHQGLRPVAQMSRNARKIADGDLSARLDPASQCEELRGLTETLNQTFDRLGEALQRQVRFTADASHELRTPLATILADCEFALRKERPTERYLETIEVCQESARHMGKLVERLGLLARLDSDEAALEREPLDLADAARRAMAWVEPLAREHGVSLHAELAEIHATADPMRIGQVLLNLLRNAITYNQAGGHVTIHNGLDNGKAWFEVEDTGQGIPEDKIARVFERFFRADESRNARTGGAGLGLAICQAIMEAHGGRIEVKSQVGVGSTFRIEWPVAVS